MNHRAKEVKVASERVRELDGPGLGASHESEAHPAPLSQRQPQGSLVSRRLKESSNRQVLELRGELR